MKLVPVGRMFIIQKPYQHSLCPMEGGGGGDEVS